MDRGDEERRLEAELRPWNCEVILGMPCIVSAV